MSDVVRVGEEIPSHSPDTGNCVASMSSRDAPQKDLRFLTGCDEHELHSGDSFGFIGLARLSWTVGVGYSADSPR